MIGVKDNDKSYRNIVNADSARNENSDEIFDFSEIRSITQN